MASFSLVAVTPVCNSRRRIVDCWLCRMSLDCETKKLTFAISLSTQRKYVTAPYASLEESGETWNSIFSLYWKVKPYHVFKSILSILCKAPNYFNHLFCKAPNHFNHLFCKALNHFNHLFCKSIKVWESHSKFSFHLISEEPT